VERKHADERRTFDALADAARAVAGLDEQARGALLAFLAEPRSPRSRPGADARRGAAALTSWISATRPLPPRDRVDALLLADRVADAIGLSAPLAPGESRDRIRLGGVELARNELAGAYLYPHGFLREALRVAPAGIARDRAVLRQMEIRFDETRQCSGGDEVFEKVIAAGEPLIARTEDREVRIAARFMVGDAYATIVSLAAGAAGEYADASRYAARAPAARQKALAHLREGIALDPGSERARTAWRTAWRLLAELPPGAPTYFCIHD
jgi:hypothetical protein